MKKQSNDELRLVSLAPGTIILTKRYCWLKRWFYRLIGKELPYNVVDITVEGVGMFSWLNTPPKNVVAFTPIKEYNKKDINKLKANYPKGKISVAQVIELVNKVRPNTFTESDINAIKYSRYYRAVDFVEEAHAVPEK